LSSDSNRPRPRSSKKQRAREGGAARPTATQPAKGGPTQGGSVAGGIPTLWLVVIGVVVFAIGAALAGGAIQFGGRGANPSSPPAGGSVAAGGSVTGGIPGGCPTAQPPAAPAGQTRVVTIETAKGQMQLTLKADLSPIAVGNFTALVSCGYYDGIVFHRVATLQDGTPFVIQGGDPDGTGMGGPGYEIQDEPVTTPYVRGTVAMARTAAPNSVGSQFFIVLDDKDGAILAQANTYQIIGSVTTGMETADAIYAAANGQENPADPVVMTKVSISNP
jgi:cyclophilin family peptidyl-prolyl cis-trans isomerase